MNHSLYLFFFSTFRVRQRAIHPQSKNLNRLEHSPASNTSLLPLTSRAPVISLPSPLISPVRSGNAFKFKCCIEGWMISPKQSTRPWPASLPPCPHWLSPLLHNLLLSIFLLKPLDFLNTVTKSVSMKKKRESVLASNTDLSLTSRNQRNLVLLLALNICNNLLMKVSCWNPWKYFQTKQSKRRKQEQ